MTADARVRRVAPAGRGSWWTVELDDGRVFRLTEAGVAALALSEGERLGAARLAELDHRQDWDRAYQDALRLLSYRQRSRSELDRRLRRKGHPPELIETLLASLADRGYVDDGAFAQVWVRDRLIRNPAGRRRLVAELARSGVDRATAEQAVDEALTALAAHDGGDGHDGGADVALAERALAKRRRGRGGAALIDPDERRRTIAYLQRRGFDWSTIRHVMRRAASNSGDLSEDVDGDVPLA